MENQYPKKIIFIYEDKINVLEDEDAEKYVKIYDGLCAVAQNRGGNQNPYSYPENKLNWKQVVPIKDSDIVN